MSREYVQNFSRDKCPHKSTIDDDRDGVSICTDCGKIVEQILYPYTNSNYAMDNYSTQHSNIYYHIEEACNIGNLPDCLIEYTEEWYKRLKYHLTTIADKQMQKIKDKDLASYALADSLYIFETPRTLQEIESYTETSVEILCSIQKLMQNKSSIDSADDPTLYADRYCANLNLSFHHIKMIKGIIRNMFGLGHLCPNTIVATVIYLYQKEQKLGIKLKDICEACIVSPGNIHKIIRGLQPKYKENISLLYT